MIIVNESIAPTVNVGGQGGKEKILTSIFKDVKVVSEPLFDAVTTTGVKLEFKKQADLQWFDVGKYYNLREEDREILMTFILTGSKELKGKIDCIFTIPLGRFIDILTTTEKYKRDGWEHSNIEMCHNQKKKYPTQQAKLQVKVRQFLKDNLEDVDMLWVR